MKPILEWLQEIEDPTIREKAIKNTSETKLNDMIVDENLAKRIALLCDNELTLSKTVCRWLGLSKQFFVTTDKCDDTALVRISCDSHKLLQKVEWISGCVEGWTECSQSTYQKIYNLNR